MQAGSTITPKDEPPTSGKVILTTTNGDLEIQLWAKEMPIACRNFVQHCLDGYYDNTIFHRMIPGFMIQGGDPTGTGAGGESIYGEPFKNEYHQRIKFSRRGMVAMANSGRDINKSQFFITFGQCTHLNKDHTIFGKIVGDSIYNLLSFQSLDTDKLTDRPTDPPYIRKAKVLNNPFDDMTPNPIKKTQSKPQEANPVENKKKPNKTQIKKLKNKKRLTFDDDDEEAEQQNYKVKSSHDMLNDEKLSKKVAITQEELEAKRKEKEEEERKKQEIVDRLALAGQSITNAQNKSLQELLEEQMQRKKKLVSASSLANVDDQILNYKKEVNPETGKVQIFWGNKDQIPEEDGQDQQDQYQKMHRLRQLQERQYEGLKADELNFKKLKQGTMKQRRKQLVAEQKQLLSNVEKRKYEFLKKQKLAQREGELNDKLQMFKNRLSLNKANDWMCHKLKFHIDSENAYDLDKKNKERELRGDNNDE